MDFGGSISPTEKNSANARRDNIAQHMWAQYQEYIANSVDHMDEQSVEYLMLVTGKE